MKQKQYEKQHVEITSVPTTAAMSVFFPLFLYCY